MFPCGIILPVSSIPFLGIASQAHTQCVGFFFGCLNILQSVCARGKIRCFL